MPCAILLMHEVIGHLQASPSLLNALLAVDVDGTGELEMDEFKKVL